MYIQSKKKKKINDVFNIISFKILNDLTVCTIFLDPKK